MKNDYLEQVQQEALEVDLELKRKRRAPAPQLQVQAMQSAMPAPPPSMVSPGSMDGITAGASGSARGAGSLPRGGHSMGIRITGWWPFQTVVVPPNVYVVHTTRGVDKPVHVGLGVSFAFNPFRDSFLVVPAAMQTIQINARSICAELQGVMIQAYVQWIIDDIEVAYRRLDFSDLEDPMGVVNIQLREQAEAAIKDKVATMSIHEVLSDKQPIIEELTRRLKTVAEGSGDDRGLGIRIVTVQIKEAVVSSTRVWDSLQGPFRAQQRTKARLAEIEAQEKVAEREREEQVAREKAEAEVERLRQAAEAETERLRAEEAARLRQQKLEVEHAERIAQQEQAAAEEKRRLELEIQRYAQQVAELEARLAQEQKDRDVRYQLETRDRSERDKLAAAELEARLQRDRQQHDLQVAQEEDRVRFEAERQKIANDLSDTQVRLRAVETIPEVARAMPKPERLESLSIGGGGADGSLAGTIAQVMAVLRQAGVVGGSGAPARVNGEQPGES